MSASSLIPTNEPRFQVPDARGRFGQFGGLYVPETLMTPLLELAKAYDEARRDPAFQSAFTKMLNEFAGRPTGLYFAEGLTKHCGGAKIYLKREDMLHTGAHKINNAIGQALLAVRMGKKRIIA
ncbi:pyridoxal-phosphate dependent enzyme, partial [bacterium]|nr:pyridoxal-phosphate dependent enzyme [bacterium]